jgi:2'-5' RNA ligase
MRAERLFFAVKPGGLFLKALEAVSGELKSLLRNASFVPVQNIHLTLCFIGETDKTESIKAAAAGVAFEPFDLEIDKLGVFRGDLIWIGLKSSDALFSLSAAIRAKMRDNGISFDPKPFKPHITIARRADIRSDLSFTSVNIPKASMRCDKFGLYRSERSEGKQIYTLTAEFQH